MVTTGTKRSYKGYRRRKTMTTPTGIAPLYPSIYDSCCIYFNQTYIYASTQGNPISQQQYYLTTGMTISAAFTNLSNYFSKFRVEKMTIEFTADQNAPISEVSMAEIHDTKVWPNNNVSIDSQASLKTFTMQGGRPRCIWKMNPALVSDTQFLDIPTVQQAQPVNVSGGIMLAFRGTYATAPQTMVAMASINIKYKVRFQGRLAIAVT